MGDVGLNSSGRGLAGLLIPRMQVVDVLKNLNVSWMQVITFELDSRGTLQLG
jgi:hypothetical protein